MTIQESSRTPTLSEIIRQAMDQRIRDVHTLLPGKIETYDPTTQKASVKPLIKRLDPSVDGGEILEPLPVITDCPVVFPRAGGGAFMSWPLKTGDFVTLEFVERSLEVWLNSEGGDANPDDFRDHDLTDCIVRPGLYPFSKALNEAHPDNITVGFEGGATVHLMPDGTVSLGEDAAGDWVGLASLINKRFDDFENTFKAHAADRYNKHVHKYVLPLIPVSDAETVSVESGDKPEYIEPPFINGGNVQSNTVRSK